MKEITEGIETTGIKAGVIKVATGYGCISTYEEGALRAAARASKETGVPIITHTEGGTMGPEQADLLISEGADPKRIVIGHACGSADLNYHAVILKKGVYLGFDRLGIELPPVSMPDCIKKACILGLIGLGYANRIVLSHDFPIWVLGRPVEEFKAQVLPNWHPRHVFTRFIPALKEAGQTDTQLNAIMIENPKRLFGGE